MVRVSRVGVLLIACGCASQVATAPVAATATPPAAVAAPLSSVAKPPPPAATPAVPPAPARQMAEDGTITMASGSTLTVAKGWFVTDDKDLLLIEDPEHQVKLVMVELGTTAAADRDAAVTAAWARFRPGFALKVARKVDLPARDGWDAVGSVNYVTDAKDNRVVQALARRKGATWYVWMVDANTAAVDRRAAQLALARRSFKPLGLVEESFAGKTAHPFDAAKQQQLAAFIEQARNDADVPGVAIGVVQGGKLVYQQGFGTKDRDDKKPAAVTPTTLFMIGSNTKALTTLLMARLIDRGVFAWTTPVTQLLPTFALGDAEMTRRLTMQHTVCACTGMPRYDAQFALFEYAGSTPESRLAQMKTMVPTTGFGETFQYSNLMVAAGGFIAGHAASPANQKMKLGPAYDGAMQAEVFRPLGMRATTLDLAKAARADHAAPHAHDMDLIYRRIPLSREEGVVAVRPAGSVWSNVRDMSRYLLLELGKGVIPEGKRVVSEANLLHRREPQVKMNDETSYGLGLMVTRDHGVPVVQHGGNNAGFSSDMYLLPEHGIGVVVLTNGAATNVFMGAVRRRLFELLFDGKPEAAENLAASLARDKTARKELVERITPEGAAKEWLGSLTGEYSNAALGKLNVKVNGTGAVMDAGEWTSPLVQEVALDGSLKLMTNAPGIRVAFEVGPRTLTFKTAQQDYVFAMAGAAPAPVSEVLSEDEAQTMCAEDLPKQMECKEDFCAAMVAMRTATKKMSVEALAKMQAKCLEEIAVDGTGDVGTRKGRCAGWMKARGKLEMKRTEAAEMTACWGKATCKERVECWGPKMAGVMQKRMAAGGGQ